MLPEGVQISGKKYNSGRCLNAKSTCMIISFLCLIYSCRNNRKDILETNAHTHVELESSNNQYTTSDPIEFGMGGMGMSYSILYKNLKPIDTIDACFHYELAGNDSIVYLSVKIWYDSSEGICGNIKEYVLLTGNKKTVLKNNLPYLDDYFSSPILFNNQLYYWGIKKLEIESGKEKLYAMRYDFKKKYLDSIYLKDYTQEGTDDMTWYSVMLNEENEIVFKLFNSEQWYIDIKNFKIKNKISL